MRAREGNGQRRPLPRPPGRPAGPPGPGPPAKSGCGNRTGGGRGPGSGDRTGPGPGKGPRSLRAGSRSRPLVAQPGVAAVLSSLPAAADGPFPGALAASLWPDLSSGFATWCWRRSTFGVLAGVASSAGCDPDLRVVNWGRLWGRSSLGAAAAPAVRAGPAWVQLSSHDTWEMESLKCVFSIRCVCVFPQVWHRGNSPSFPRCVRCTEGFLHRNGWGNGAP